jgi:predicted nucleic-acid-binding Zn-ribbon protein
MEKNKIQNKQSSLTSIKWLCARCGNCGNEEFYVSDDVLEEENTASYQMLPKKSKLRYQKELKA